MHAWVHVVCGEKNFPCFPSGWMVATKVWSSGKYFRPNLLRVHAECDEPRKMTVRAGFLIFTFRLETERQYLFKYQWWVGITRARNLCGLFSEVSLNEMWGHILFCLGLSYLLICLMCLVYISNGIHFVQAKVLYLVHD